MSNLLGEHVQVFKALLPVVLSMAGSTAFASTLEGQTLIFQHIHHQGGVIQQAVVNAEIEFKSRYFWVDASDDGLLILFRETAPYHDVAPLHFNGFVLEDRLGTVPSFASASLLAGTNVPGFDSSRISLTPDRLMVNFAGLTIEQGMQVQLSLSAVPEAPTAMLFALGGLILTGVARRARSRPAGSIASQALAVTER